MSANMKNVIEEVQRLNAHERAIVAHYLISSLETKQDGWAWNCISSNYRIPLNMAKISKRFPKVFTFQVSILSDLSKER